MNNCLKPYTEYSKPAKKKGPPFGNQNAKGHGAPKGNRNAVGREGGGEIGNKKAERHGFYSRKFPDIPDIPDIPEIQEMINSTSIKAPLEKLFQNIVIKCTAIARAQRLMTIKDRQDTPEYAKAENVALTRLKGLLKRYEKALLNELATEDQLLQLEKLKAEFRRLNGDDGEGKDAGGDNL